MQFYFHESDGDVLIIRADGGLDDSTINQFANDIKTLVDNGTTKIIVDCSGLKYISSTGIGMLLRFHKRMAKRGGDVKLAGVKGLVAQTLRMMAVDSLFAIYPDVDQARLAFRPAEA